MVTTELTKTTNFSDIEQVLMTGDLAKLTSAQRVEYYNAVCKSIGLNPLTRPFDYITLNNKLTLYARKDATDQLRNLRGVSIDDVEMTDDKDSFIVKVKGSINGRRDVEVGIVKKTDMQGNAANAQMKAVTKAKRRLTLSLCGLGWLDETEVETIPNARPVFVQPETGEIIGDVKASLPAPKSEKAATFTPAEPVSSDITGTEEGVSDEINDAFPPKTAPVNSTKDSDLTSQEFRHSALWKKAGKANLLTKENMEVWRRSPKDTAEDIAAKCELMHAALDPTYGSDMPNPRTGDGENR